jgi:hypothetical protein
VTAVLALAVGGRGEDGGGTSLRGRVVAVGIPGISAISPVGTFLPGGPIHDNPTLAAFTQPGRVLDPVRILVGSTSNFAAPLANLDQDEGSFLSIDPTGDEGEDSASPRLGVVLNYSPSRILYVTEPTNNSIAALDLVDDGTVFHVAEVRRVCSEALNHPIDLTPAAMETEDHNWASNTTLDVNADFYVANRGNNTIVRLRQDGTAVGIRHVRLQDGQSLGERRINGIAASPDGSRIWVTVTGRIPGHGDNPGAVLELTAFAN